MVPSARPPGRRGDPVGRADADAAHGRSRSRPASPRGSTTGRPGSSSCASWPDAAGLSAPRRCSAEAAARVSEPRPRTRLDWRGARQGLRLCESEGRCRQDDQRGQPRCVPRRGRRARRRRRPRSAGERDLGPRAPRERHVDVRPARRRDAAGLAKPTRFENLFLVPSRPELAGAAVELSRRDDGDRFLADALGHGEGFDFVLLDCPPSLGPLTVNALAAATACRRAGPDRVLRAGGARAARPVDRARQARASIPSWRSPACC